MTVSHPPVLGIAGNFTGHLEQAGEAKDFVAVKAAAGKPKGLFPMYLPIEGHRLGTWPFSADTLRLPAHEADVQPEPEVALRCAVTWSDAGVARLAPLACAAFDDTSIRNPPQPKISMKKNWGPASKGLSDTWLPIDRFDASGAMAHLRLTCFLGRGGTWLPYGEDSAVADYSTIWAELLDWAVDRLNHQEDVGPLEPVGAYLHEAARPSELILSIGATRYTEHGEGGFVQDGDVVAIVVYDGRTHSGAQVAAALEAGTTGELGGASVLIRTVRA